MSLETEYRGYTISYSENADTWGCYACGVDAPTLSKAKEKIDKLHLKLRKESAVSCYEIKQSVTDRGVSVRALDATVIDYLGRKESRSWSTGKATFEGHRVASMATRRGNERKSRSETMLDKLAPISPETESKIENANRLGKIAHEAMEAFRAAYDEIPRLQFEDIKGLVEASEHKFEEGEA